jgi:hypothetical protein
LSAAIAPTFSRFLRARSVSHGFSFVNLIELCRFADPEALFDANVFYTVAYTVLA